MSETRRHRLLGLPVDCLTFEETMAEVEAIVARGAPTQHVVINVGKVVMAADEPRLAGVIDRCALVNADGAGVVWAARLLGVPVPERVTGIDLFIELVARAAGRGWRPYLLGARPEVVARVAEILTARHPGLELAGYRDGYWTPAEELEVVRAIADSGADLLFVAITSPRKEYWLDEHLEALGVPFAMGVGGAFDVVAGVTRRAPEWMQKAGLEWFFRLVQEPRRMWRRYLVGNARFGRMVVAEALRRRRRDSGGLRS